MAYPVIKRGSTGAYVALAQQALKSHGLSLTVDSKFGPTTESLVKKFQSTNGLSADGIVGPNTWAKLAPKSAVNAYTAGTKQVGLVTNTWGNVVPPASVTVWTEVYTGSGWSRSQVSKSDSNGKFVIPLTYGATTPGKYRWRVRAQTPSGIATSNEFYLTRTAPANNTSEAKSILSYLGWRVDTNTRLWQAVRDFQRMWNLGPALAVDGQIGPATIAALRLSKSRKDAGKADISANFSAVEFRCKCGGRYSNCRRIWAHRDLVRACEKYRSKYGPFTPISACRCDSHNAAVGGYVYSQHRYGNAVDLIPEGTANGVQSLGVASGIGIQRATGLVRHMDLRHLGPKNYPYATLSSPRRYYYG